MSLKNREQLIFLGLLAALFAGVFFTSLTFDPKAMYFPIAIGCGFFVLTLMELARTYIVDIKSGDTESSVMGAEMGAEGPVSDVPLMKRVPTVLPFLLWLGGYYAGIYVIGFLLTTPVFIFTFLWRVADLSVLRSAISAIFVGAAIYGFARIMSLEWPRGLIEYTFNLQIG